LSPGLQRRVVWQEFTNVSAVLAASIIRAIKHSVHKIKNSVIFLFLRVGKMIKYFRPLIFTKLDYAWQAKIVEKII
jgi:hypothetical protein